MVNIILSIKPEFADKILNGEKKFEFRKIVPQQNIDLVFLYSCAPMKKIVGCFKIKRLISGYPSQVWKSYGKDGGISRSKFFEYFNKCSIAHCYEVSDVMRFNPPIDPYDEIKHFSAPQSFRYIEDEILI